MVNNGLKSKMSKNMFLELKTRDLGLFRAFSRGFSFENFGSPSGWDPLPLGWAIEIIGVRTQGGGKLQNFITEGSEIFENYIWRQVLGISVEKHQFRQNLGATSSF